MSEPVNSPPVDEGASRRRPAWWWWVAGAVAVVLAVSIGIALTRPTSDDASPTATGTSASASETASATSSAPSSTPTEEPSAPAEGEAPAPAPAPEPGSTQTAPIDGTGTPAADVTARVALIEAVDGTAELPGEVGGPSLRVSVEITNGTASALDLTTAVVNLYYGADATPATPLGQPGTVPFAEQVEPGASSTGTFVFNVPVDARDDVTIELDLSVGSAVVLLRGPAGV
ncbi:DUF4352 domain-containing protein [Cellulomonas xylanilytica]|uniref:DUF4352 domain-containing protein n=1 Tax=Cellulomonas xylanilytica TaxID=233583 RepID=A0A510V364_9CELL|nr:DUF4352 domain-containing protein [Cellulomonas xylanilytica]GEK21314.1 hypothetical protein CXY01_18340 [Cellulomonas xylanilytica]